MAYLNDPPMFYPEDYDYYPSQLNNYQSPTPQIFNSKKTPILPNINYLNERKCPIYVHEIRNDSSVYNNYNQPIFKQKKKFNPPQNSVQNTSKFVLDKLEETYWATWKPKKLENNSDKSRTLSTTLNLKPAYNNNKLNTKSFVDKPHGDINDNIIKYFKAKRYDSSSTTDSVTQNEKKLNRPSRTRRLKVTKQDSISQEIQTEVHCPIILEQPKETEHVSVETFNQPGDNENIEEKTVKTHTKQTKKTKVKKTNTTPDPPTINDENKDGSGTFIEHKDSIEIIKKKQDKSGSKEHFPQPKCIKLYRKSGSGSGHIKGGSYPLKSCLKKELPVKGNFRLGAPGGTLFVANSSFATKKRK